MVAVRKRGFVPCPARDHVLVAFDGDARGVDSHLGQQAGDGDSGRRGANLAVDGDAQVVHECGQA
jgi:hypothetical protein